MKVKALTSKKYWQRKFNEHRHGGPCCGWIYDDLSKRSRLDHAGIENTLKRKYPNCKIKIPKY